MARQIDSAYDVITVRSDAGLVRLVAEFKTPNLKAVEARAKDLRPVFVRIKALGWLDDPASFVRDDRKRGGMGRPDKDGRSRNWGPGYPKTSFGRTKRTFTIRSRRPFHPRTTEAVEVRITEAVLAYLVTGVLP